MKQRNQTSGEHPIRERLAAVASALLLTASLLLIFVFRLGHAVSHRARSFYYDHLYHRLHRLRAAFASVRAHRMQAMTLIMTLVLLVPMASVLRPVVAVKVDGRVLGYVQNESAVTAVCREIEQTSSAVLGEPFQLDANITYEVAVTALDNLMEPQDLSAAIADSADNLSTLAVVKVNGQAVGALEDAAEAQSVLDRIKQSYQDDDSSAEVTLLDDVAVETMQAPTKLLQSEDALYTTLTETSTQPDIVEATADDTLSSIAQAHGMLVDEILALNPDIVPEALSPGTKVTITAAKPLVSVQIKKTIDYTEAIPYDTVTRKSDDLAKNKVQVIQQGVPGEATIEAQVVLVNGVEQERTILSRTVLSNATDKIVEVGTKNIGVGTGTLRRPIAGGTITSGFKWRWGRMHKGIDIADSIGTPVMAADNGKVIYAGYSTSGYGKYIIVNHNNGMKTLYAHNSVLKVEVGDVVEKGQTIALSGNTGNSTGPHLHFEVLVDDVNVDPMKYID
ncbi:MAG: peptidoglycan DD-metalloendopeptidase family protein [Intestinibacillus sp.]